MLQKTGKIAPQNNFSDKGKLSTIYFNLWPKLGFLLILSALNFFTQTLELKKG